MSNYNTKLQTNNSTIQSLIDAANALPDASGGGSSGGDTSVEDALVTRTLTSYENDRVETIGSYAFYNCHSLTSISFPACTTIGSNAFAACSSLTSISFPACTTIGSYAFYYCSKLTEVSFPACTFISSAAFSNCTNLSQIYLTGSSVCSLAYSNAFFSTKITSTTGSIFVPTSLVSTYKTAAQWSYFANRIFGIYTGGSSGGGID